jgi:hypothetical protein
MNYDQLYLVDDIKEHLQGEGLTQFDNTWFEYDDCVVRITGYVQQDCEFVYSTDHFLLSNMELTSQHANFDEIFISCEEDERSLTVEEIYSIEKMLEI